MTGFYEPWKSECWEFRRQLVAMSDADLEALAIENLATLREATKRFNEARDALAKYNRDHVSRYEALRDAIESVAEARDNLDKKQRDVQYEIGRRRSAERARDHERAQQD